ncbi:1502_t:CDS:2, partial [Gigaspora margarita]
IDAQHMADCEGINTPTQRTVMPEEGKNIYKFMRYDRMLDAPFTCTADAETFAMNVDEKRGLNTTAIQKHKIASIDYIIRRSDGECSYPVKIRGDDPAGDFIKAMQKEVENMQDFLASGHIIRKSAEELSNMLHSGILPEKETEKFLNICEAFRIWKLRGDYEKEIRALNDLYHALNTLYEIHKRKPLGRDIGRMYHLAKTIWYRLKYPGEPMKKLTKAEENHHNSAKDKFDGHIISQAMGRASEEAITAIPHNMENYLSFDIGDQRYMDSLQIMAGSLDSHVSNLGAEPSMPTGGHRWLEPGEIPELFDKVSKCEIPDDAPKGYILE